MNYIVQSNISASNQIIEVERIREKDHYEKVLNHVFKDFETLKVFVETTGVDNLTEELFNDFVDQEYIPEHTYFSYSIAPDGIVEYYYSEYTNNDIIGHNFLTDPRQPVRDSIMYTIDHNVYSVSEPVDLILGSQGVTFRRAIFEDGEFKAIISLVVYYDVLNEMFMYQDSDVIDIGVYNDKNVLIFGNLEYSTPSNEISDIPIEGIDWRFGVNVSEAHQSNISRVNTITLITGSVLYILISILAIIIYTRNYRLLITQKELIYYDKLTKLPNRRMLMKDLKTSMDKQRPFFLGFGDLDNFKYLNDLLGHSYGDIFLQSITDKFNALSSEIFNIYRWGGDEFIFVIYTDKTNEAIQHFDNIYKALKEPINVKNTKYNALISIGIVKYPEHGNNVDDLVKHADIIMYDIKSDNKNTFKFFQTKYIDNLEDELMFEEKVNQYSIKDFDLYLQPLVYTKDNTVYGFEALTRLFDEEGQLIHTGKLIKYLERQGEIQNLERHMFDQLCQIANRIKDETGNDYRYSFNLSPLTLSSDHIKYMKDTLKKHNVKANCFIIEITEGLGFKDINSSIEMLEQLRNIGFLIAMDDFGIGFSSLSYISKLPLNLIKIDKYFIQNSKQSNFESNLLETISNISKSLKIDVIAEGVETKEQLGIIKDLGNLLYQGYLHSKPMSVDAIIKQIKNDFN